MTSYDWGEIWFEQQPWARKAWFHKQVNDGTYEWRHFFRSKPTAEYMRGVNQAYETWLKDQRPQRGR